MARVQAHLGRRRFPGAAPQRVLGSSPLTVQSTRRVLRTSLVAAGLAPAPLLPTYEMTMGSASERYFYEAALGEGLTVYDGDSWPTEASLAADPAPILRDGDKGVYRLDDGTLVLAHAGHGWARIQVAAGSENPVYGVMTAFRAQYPPSYAVTDNDGRVPVTFWTDGRFGPTARLRRIEASPWESIDGNYSSEVAGELGEMMGWTSGPEREGQLLAWLGPPGTGKTWALRALVSEWSPWAEFHYITDPDAFFVDNPSYMVDVLLADSYEQIDPSSGDLVTEIDAEGKWRVLILEDTGELLSAGAKEKYGQGLSRLLNVVDGMIGQGLRVLALVTTNDQLSDFHPAVTRPGRCASLLTFGPLSDAEAKTWTGNPAAVGGTLAELYAQRGTGLTAEVAYDPEDAAGEVEAAAEALVAASDAERAADEDAWADVLALASKPLVLGETPGE